MDNYLGSPTSFKTQLSPVPKLETSPSSVSVAANTPHLSVSEDDGEEVIIEPRFKYHRLLRQMPDKDSISCFAVCDKLIAVGCSSGKIRIFDVIGNLRTEFTVKKHKCAISQINIDNSGSYVITCANDSTVSITGIGSSEHNYTVPLHGSAKSVSIAENFTKKGCQKFVIGARKLLLYEKTFFGKYSEKILYEGKEQDGLIGAISWKEDNIAFTNETGTRIFDCKRQKFFVVIPPLHNPEPFYSSRYPPIHSWFDEKTLVIGWGSAVTVVNIEIVNNTLDSTKNGIKRGNIIYRFRLDNLRINIAGISFISDSYLQRGWKEIVVFGIKITEQKFEPKNDGDDSTISQTSGKSNYSVAQSVMAVPMNLNQRASIELLLLLPESVDNYILAAEDEISMKQSEQTFLRQYHLGGMPEYSIYYLLGPKELIEAKPPSLNDRITWFLDNELYIEATLCSLKHRDELDDGIVSDVGRKLIDHLILNNDFDLAAKYLPKICGKKKEEWEYFVNLFENHNQILKLVPYLPIKQPQLEAECYQSILLSALACKSELFLKLIKYLPSDLYRIGALIQTTIGRLNQLNNKSEKVMITQALARLFTYERQFDKALVLYMKLKDPEIFTFIRQYHQFNSVKDRVAELMEINEDLAIRLLLDHEAEISNIKKIIPQLGRMPKIQMEYLNQLWQRSGGNFEYSDILIKLFGEYSIERLLPFLRKSDNYDLDKAIDICKTKKLYHELVFLLGRSGNKLEALETIVEQMDRIDIGIEFCAEHSDTELWKRLIDMSMSKPEYVSEVLKVAGTYVDPLIVIKQIPHQMKVPNLQKLLQKVLRDSELQLSLITDCQSSGFQDVMIKFDQFINRPAVIVDQLNECSICGKQLLYSQTDILLQECGHQFHVKCVKLPEINPFDDELCKRLSFISFTPDDPGPPPKFCPICNLQKQNN